jgi:hypothetical protein
MEWFFLNSEQRSANKSMAKMETLSSRLLLVENTGTLIKQNTQKQSASVFEDARMGFMSTKFIRAPACR